MGQVLQLGAGCDPHHTGHVRQAHLAGKAPRALKPVDVAGHGDGALLDARCPLSRSVALSSAAGSAAANRASTSERSVGWLALMASR